ncbi:MAG: hypothetical protein KAW90_07065, partial [Dehalococcoidales bacterium]|nr:hypothetical protein [Dehalococcoidales bacterium]
MLRLPFEIKACPGECGKECGAALEKCPIFSKLPEDFQEVCQENPHLLQYLRMLPEDKIGIPQYYEKVTRALKGTKDPNLIYNVGGGVFVHVLANTEDVRDYYIAIEPSIIDAQESTLDEIELKLTDYVEELEGVADSAKRLEIIIGIVDRIVSIDGHKAPEAPPDKNKSDEDGKEGKNGKSDKNKKEKKSLFPKSKGSAKGKIQITNFQYTSLRYLLRRKLEGMGLLDPMKLDPNIEAISCSGLGNMFVEHKIFGGLRASIGFETNETLD